MQSATEAAEPQTVELEEGLQLHYIGKYAGLYMEDGTNEAVANVMMMNFFMTFSFYVVSDCLFFLYKYNQQMHFLYTYYDLDNMYYHPPDTVL